VLTLVNTDQEAASIFIARSHASIGVGDILDAAIRLIQRWDISVQCHRDRADRPALQRLLALLLFVLIAAVAPGCSVSEALHSEPGIDISGIKPGMPRAEVEAIVGAPQGQWTTSLGVQYFVYQYYGGMESDYMGAAAFVFMDIATLGTGEFFKPEASSGRKKYARMAVSYDLQDRVIGAFPNFDPLAPLPADGRPMPNHERK